MQHSNNGSPPAKFGFVHRVLLRNEILPRDDRQRVVRPHRVGTRIRPGLRSHDGLCRSVWTDVGHATGWRGRRLLRYISKTGYSVLLSETRRNRYPSPWKGFLACGSVPAAQAWERKDRCVARRTLIAARRGDHPRCRGLAGGRRVPRHRIIGDLLPGRGTRSGPGPTRRTGPADLRGLPRAQPVPRPRPGRGRTLRNLGRHDRNRPQTARPPAGSRRVPASHAAAPSTGVRRHRRRGLLVTIRDDRGSPAPGFRRGAR